MGPPKSCGPAPKESNAKNNDPPKREAPRVPGVIPLPDAPREYHRPKEEKNSVKVPKVGLTGPKQVDSPSVDWCGSTSQSMRPPYISSCDWTRMSPHQRKVETEVFRAELMAKHVGVENTGLAAVRDGNVSKVIVGALLAAPVAATSRGAPNCCETGALNGQVFLR